MTGMLAADGQEQGAVDRPCVYISSEHKGFHIGKEESGWGKTVGLASLDPCVGYGEGG